MQICFIVYIIHLHHVLVNFSGHVLLNEFWQAEMGDFSLDQKRFPTMKETINIIHRRGFRIVVTIQPFISTESSNFANAVREGILVSTATEC